MGECKPRITYPCPWVYKVIGRDRHLIESAVAEILSGRAYRTEPSKSSRGGAYHCLNVETRVESEADRVANYDRLRRHPDVIMVL